MRNRFGLRAPDVAAGLLSVTAVMAVAFGAELAGETPQSSAAGAESTPNWPSFRGHGATGVAESARPPIAWNTETGNNIRWTTTIAGHSHSSPVIWGDVIYVVTSMSEDPSSDGRRRGVRNNAIDDLAERECEDPCAAP